MRYWLNGITSWLITFSLSQFKTNFQNLLLFNLIPNCGPRISAHAFPTRWQARFRFEKKDFY